MRINFLTADGNTRLAKSYTPTSKTPYPLVNLFTSHTYDIHTLEKFYTLIQEFAQRGGCLLKGELLRPLVNESRAGSTSPDTPTRYGLLDVDRCDPEITTPEAFILRCLPPIFHDVDYIFQWSNSAGICKPGLTGHFWFLFTQDINVKLLKKALTQFNFFSPHLEDQIFLAHNGQTLTYGLDPTCAQNDKLIFIAPPTLIDLTDPHPERLFLVKRQHRAVTLELSQINVTELDQRCKLKLAELRTAAGLPRRAAKYKNEGPLEILANPEKAIFRGPYRDERGFRYGNLNNGDSYAYFHHAENPKYLYNFKGEPVVRLQDIDPDYWRQLNAEQRPIDPTKIYLAFRDCHSDTYYTTVYDKLSNTHTTYIVGNEKKALDFLRIHQQPIPEPLPIWDVLFDPTADYLIDLERQKLNLFQKSAYLKNATPSTYCPTKFKELILHVVGNDPEMYEDFINWLAFIIQRRTKTQTAFILHGRTGTGKGVLFTKIIQPILGFLHCPMIMMDDIDRPFNEWVETSLLVVVDEAQISDDLKRAKKRINRIKNLITEAPTLLNKKNVQITQITNHLNFIFTSNEHDSIWINEQDRRFKVCPRQEHALQYTQHDIDEIESEIQLIANYLVGYPVNDTRVRAVPHNKARERLIESTQTPIDEFVDLLKKGDLDSLLQYRHEFLNSKNALFHTRFVELLDEWSLQVNELIPVSNSDLRILYSYLFSTEISPTRFGKLLASKNLRTLHGWVNGKTTRYIEICWRSELIHTSPTPQRLPPCVHGTTVN